MAAHVGLAALTPELLDAIVKGLALQDICNLRLTATVLAAKVVRTSFKSCFRSKTVRLTHEGLKAFSTVTKQYWISSALEHLTLTGMVYCAEDQGDKRSISDHESLTLLTSGLENLCLLSGHALCSLVLNIKCPDARYGSFSSPQVLPEWQSVWQCAGDMAQLTAKAVKASSLRIEQLDLYGGTIRCALSSDKLWAAMHLFDARALKALSLTISRSYSETVDDIATGTETFQRQMIRMLDSLEHLESLTIRWFSLRPFAASDAELADYDIPAWLAATPVPPPRLATLSLRGLYASQASLLSLLTTYSHLTDLSLEEIHLTNGRFLPIFAYVDGQKRLDTVYLNDLWETRLIQFLGVSGKSHFPHAGGPTWMRRTPEKRRRAIRYQQETDERKQSAASNNWYQNRKLLYGPI